MKVLFKNISKAVDIMFDNNICSHRRLYFLILCFLFNTLLFACLCLISPLANAEGTWKEIHHVLGSNWEDVFFLDESYGWVVGDRGAIMSTKDGGKNWNVLQREYSEIPWYKGCFFLSEKQGWIVGYNSLDGVIMSTNDGGVTLKQQVSSPDLYFYDVYFISSNEGWVAGFSIGQGDRVVLLHTENAGKDWEAQDVSGTGELHKIFFIDDRKGFVVGPSDFFFQTDDGGKTWIKKPIPNIKTGLDVFFLNPNEGWIAGFNSLIKTTDGGITWQEVPTQAGAWFPSMWFKNSNEGYVLAIDGSTGTNLSIILQTKDGGKSFEQQEKTYSCLRSIVCIGDNYWVVGYDNTILYSDDSKNWTLQTERAYSFTDIDFVTKSKGFMAGVSSFNSSLEGDFVLFSTSDGGNNWEQVSGSIPDRSCHIDFVDSSSGGISGFKGLYHTEDAGKTIQKVDTISEPLGDMVFPTKDDGWIIGDSRGCVWRTSDGGETWKKTDVDAQAYLVDIEVIGNKGWVAGWASNRVSLGGVVYITEDGGKSFKKVAVDKALAGISFVTEDKGWAVGYHESIFVTEDGGKSWKKQLISDTNIFLYDVLFLSEDEGWAVGGYDMSGVILHTTDGGKTWVTQMSNTIEQINKIVYVGGDYLIAIGEWGTILKYTDSSLLQYSNRFAVSDNKSQPITWGAIKSQLYQNYPNPFNPETWIPYYLSEDANVTLKIHNSTGQLIRTINLRHKQTGSYITRDKSAYWDGKNEAGKQVSSGVYFYTIEAGSFSSTRKMVISE